LSKDRLVLIEHALNGLVKMYKFYRLYPKNNPLVGQAVKAALTAFTDLSNFDAPDASEQNEQDPLEAQENDLYLLIMRDAFMVEAGRVAPENEVVSSFASELYLRGVRTVLLRPGLTEKELRTFVEALSSNSAPNTSLAANAPLPPFTLEHLCTESAEALDLGPKPDSVSALSFFDYVLKHGKTQAGFGGNDTFTEGSELLAAISSFFLDAAQGAPEKGNCVTDLLESPGKIADALDDAARLSDEISAGLPEADETLKKESMQRLLRHLSEAASELPQEERDLSFQNIADAVRLVGSGVRAHLLRDTLPRWVGKNVAQEGVLTFLSDEPLTEVLENHALFHDGTANSIANFLSNHLQDDARRSQIEDDLSDKLAKLDDPRMLAIGELLKKKAVGMADPSQSQSSEAQKRRDQVTDDQRAVLEKLAYKEGEKQALTKALNDAFGEPCLDYASNVILHLCDKEGVDFLTENNADLIADSISRAFAKEDFESVLRMLGQAAAPNQQPDAPGHPPRVLLEKIDMAEELNRLTTLIRDSDIRSRNHTLAISILRLLGRNVAEEAFGRLLTEKSRAKRMVLLASLVQLDESAIAPLYRHAYHKEWYVVRNLLHVLGHIGSSNSLSAVQATLKHRDERVRLEALRTLSTIGGRHAESVLLECVSKHEAQSAVLALQYLVRAQTRWVMPELRDFLEARRGFLREQPELATSLMRAFGELGEQEDIARLKRFAPPWWAIFSKGARKLRRDAKATMDTLRLKTANAAAESES
jgi:hypothetical protein